MTTEMVIIHKETGLYWLGKGKWTSSIDQARKYPSADKAQYWCERLGKNWNGTLKFDDVFSLQNGVN